MVAQGQGVLGESDAMSSYSLNTMYFIVGCVAMGATDLTLEVDASIETVAHPADGPDMYKYAALVAGLGVLQRAYVPLH